MSHQPDQGLAAYIQALPKTETHLHIEGSLPFHLLQEVNPDIRPPESWNDSFRFKSFEQFEEELNAMAIQWYTSPERYHIAAREIFNRHIEQNVRYVEVSFNAGIIKFFDIPGPEIVNAIQEAIPEGLKVRVFMGMSRDQHNERMAPILDSCIHWEGLDGIDLHGVEVKPLQAWAQRLWQAARSEGKFTKAHAGEFGGADYVKQAIDFLGVNRIEHGVRAIEDASVVDWVRERDVSFDVCPISNVKLAVVGSMKSHPIRQLMKAGVRCTINTDDTLSFGNTLNGEYTALAMDAGFNRQELARFARNGFEIALMPDSEKLPYLTQLDSLVGGSDQGC